MQIVAQLNNLRITPRKVRLVARAIKGMDATAARHQLIYVVKKSSAPMVKLLDSALNNAQNNFNLSKDNMFIWDVVVNEGPKLKRFRPKGFGMASPIEKKTSHVKIILEEKVPGLKAKGEVATSKPVTEINQVVDQKELTETRTANVSKAQTDKVKPEIKKEIGKKGSILGQVGKVKKFFRRKAI